MRKLSHFEGKEPLLESLLRDVRFYIASKYIPNNSNVADFGCGYNGKLLNNISSKIKSGVGFDISVSKNQNQSNIKLYKADINKKINFNNTKYDCITTLAVLEHVKSPNQYVKNLVAKLKPNGVLIITTPHKRSRLILETLSFWFGLISKDEIIDHKNYFTQSKLETIMKANSLKIIKLNTFEFGCNLLCVVKK